VCGAPIDREKTYIAHLKFFSGEKKIEGKK
jgi:hypothetical protein